MKILLIPVMNGKMKKKIGMIDCSTFNAMYNEQIKFQLEMKKKKPYNFDVGDLPEDNIQGFSQQIQQLVSEIGEVLSADKRWKNFRNGKIDKENKLEEIADCFIVLMNIAIYSGFTAEEIETMILNKIKENFKRLND